MANPFDSVAQGYQAAQAQAAQKPKTCAHCGQPVDDVPDVDKAKAKAFEKGATSGELPASQLWANLKAGLGVEK